VIRAAFFDVGGTLVRPWPSVGEVYARVGARHGIVREPAELEAAFRAAWKQLPAVGGLTSSSREWWRQLVFAAVPGATDGYFEDLYAEFTRAAAWQIFPEVPAVLAAVRARGAQVGLISNWDERLRPLLANLGLGEWDSVTISCEVGVEKPAAEMFGAALRAAGVAAAEAVHLGDSVTEDVRGAEAVGMHAVWVDRTGGDDLRAAWARVGD